MLFGLMSFGVLSFGLMSFGKLSVYLTDLLQTKSLPHSNQERHWSSQKQSGKLQYYWSSTNQTPFDTFTQKSGWSDNQGLTLISSKPLIYQYISNIKLRSPWFTPNQAISIYCSKQERHEVPHLLKTKPLPQSKDNRGYWSIVICKATYVVTDLLLTKQLLCLPTHRP